MTHPEPICSVCARRWDERLGYCAPCEDQAVKKSRSAASEGSLLN